MDENLTRGYCQLRSETPRDEAPPRAGDPRGRVAPPSDPCSCVYLGLVLCGAGFLLPYNSFITAVDYYQAKYPDSTIMFDMSLTYICMAFVGVVINNLVVELLSLHTRISFGYILSVLTLLFVVLCEVVFDVFSPAVLYRVNLVAIAIVALGCTVQQSSFYGYTSMLPMRYTQAVMTGESAAGLLVSINRIVTKGLLNDPVINTIIFFCLSIATVWACCIVFHVTRRTELVRYYVSMCVSAGIDDDTRGIAHHVANPEEETTPLFANENSDEVDILDGNVTRDSYGVLVIQTPTSPSDDRPFPAPPAHDRAGSAVQSPVSQTATSQNEIQIRGQGHAYRKHITVWAAVKRGCWNRLQVARNVWPYMLCIGLAYFITLCLFPGIESEVESCRLKSWMPVMLIAIFNLFDFIGKILASIRYDWPRGRLVFLTVCRVVLVPLMMLCAAPRSSPVLQGEWWPAFISLLLGLTNGYFGSVPMILAPGKVPDEQKELTGNIMTLSYSVGLTGGSAVAYLLDAWLGPHLPYDPCKPHNVSATWGPDFHNVSHTFSSLS